MHFTFTQLEADVTFRIFEVRMNFKVAIRPYRVDVRFDGRVKKTRQLFDFF